MSTLPCPNCGATVPERNGEPVRFCGQCGTTINHALEPAALEPAAPEPAAPPRLYDRDVHEEVTVARELPDLSAYLGTQGKGQLGKTLMDAAPFGAHEQGADQMPRSAMPTPVVPPPDAPVNIIVPPTPAAGMPPRGAAGAAGAGNAASTVARTQMMAQTMNDPDVEARARQLRDAVLGAAATAPAAPPAGSPKQNLNKTMMMGGESASAARVGGGVGAGPAPAATPTSPPQAAPSPQRPDASPLSRSVLAPQSWIPPAPAAADAPADFHVPQSAAPGIDIARVVSVGPPAHLGPPADVAPASVQRAPATDPPRPSPGLQGAAPPALRTMFGMPASDLLPPAVAAPPVERAPPPPPAQKTMMGVAIPGIAPLRTGASPGPEAAHPAASVGAGPMDLRSKQSTMLGVAIPGIAPSQAPPGGAPPGPQGYYPAPPSQGRSPYGTTPQGYPAPAPHIPSQVQNTALGMMAAPEVPIVPRPMTLIDEPLPVAPFIPPKRGIPALAVVGIVAALVAVLGGVGAYFALRNSGTLTALPQLDENGRESLKIGCATCPDGTTIALGASSATVAAGAAVLPLPAPLSIGDNNLAVNIDRPGAGRDEEVKVHVPVAYRVRADLATLNARPPAITVRVEAVAGSEVKVDDKPVVLDATGRAAYPIDLSKETEGTGEAKTFERKIPFVIIPKGGAPQTGQLTARTGILPLALDAPGIELFTDKTTAAVAGQTRPGSTVTIDGQSVPVDAQGRFGVRVELAGLGDKPLEIVASAAPQAPRIAKVRVVRVASLEVAAKELEGQAPLAFDAFGPDPASKVGQKAVVEGEVVDVRASGGHTVMLVDSRRGCTKGATCLVRIAYGEEAKVARGESVRAYGRVLGSVTAR